jgi:hypothetical protein
VKSLAGAVGDIGNVNFDMGAAYPVLVIAWFNAHRASGNGQPICFIEFSSDGVTYYGTWLTTTSSVTQGPVTADAYKPIGPVFGYARYFRLRFYGAAVTTNPSVFHVKLAEVQAIQL